MPYNRDSKRLLTGSINTGGRADLLPAEDSSIIEDFSYDSVGNLRSREGSVVVGSVGGSATQIIPALGGIAIVAGEGLYFNFGEVGEAGQSVCAFQGKIWAIGSAHKFDGSNFYNWLPQPPKDPCVAVAETSDDVPISNFDNDGWVVDPTDAGTGFNNTTTVSGNAFSLDIVMLDAGQGYTATLAGGQDLSSFDQLDIQRVWVWFKHSQAIGGLTFQVDVNDGTFTVDYYTCTIPRAQYVGLSHAWHKFKIRFSQNLDNANDTIPFFTRQGNTPGKGWNSVAAFRVCIDPITVPTQIRLGKWDAIGTIPPALEGQNIVYYYTYTDNEGSFETDISPPSAPISVDRQTTKLTGFDGSPDPQVQAMNVYRTGGTLAEVLRVNSAPVQIGQQIDVNSDDVLNAQGIVMSTVNQQPPQAVGCAGPYFGRILAWGGTKPARLYWSNESAPYSFRDPDMFDGAWVDVGDSTDPIQAVTLHVTSAWIYQNNSIYILSGDPDGQTGDSILPAQVNFGILGPQSVAKGNLVDYIAVFDGLYAFNGYSATKLSTKVDKLFKGQSATLGSGQVIPPLGGDLVVGTAGDKVYVSGGSYTLVYNLSSGNWVMDSRVFTCFGLVGEQFLACLPSGEVVQLETGNDGLQLVFEKTFNWGLPDTDKVIEDFTIDLLGTLNATAYFDFGEGIGSESLGTVSGGRNVKQFNSGFGVRARSVTIRLTGNGYCEIYGLWINGYQIGRLAASYDTDGQDFGTEKLKRMREVVVDIEGGGSYSMLSDHPGGQLAARVTSGLSSAGGGRGMTHLVFEADYVGYLFRQVLSGEMRVYSMRALIQPIGTFLLGTSGEYYRSDEVDWGSERIKIGKELQVIFASVGECRIVLETDQPNTEFIGVIRQVFTITLASTAASSATENEESAVKIRLPGTIKGREYRVSAYPNNDCRIENIRIWLKEIGTPQAGPWHWADFPVQPTGDAQWVPVMVAQSGLSSSADTPA
jgi:hypothetical protein